MAHTDQMRARIARACDCFAGGVIAATVLISHPRLGATPLGELGNAHVVPIAGVLAATFYLPLNGESSPRWCALVWRLRTAALLTTGLAPFVSWWLRTDDNVYFLLLGAAAIYAGIWCLLELNALARELLQGAAAAERVRAQVAAGRIFLFYFVFIPTVGVHVSFLIACIVYRGSSLSDLRRTWHFLPPLLRYLMVLAVLHLTVLLWGLHRHIPARPFGAGTEGGKDTGNDREDCGRGAAVDRGA